MSSLDGPRFRRKSLEDVVDTRAADNAAVRASQSVELIIFAKIGMEPMVRQLLAMRLPKSKELMVDPNEQTKGDGFTALLVAVQESHHRIVDILLKVVS